MCPLGSVPIFENVFMPRLFKAVTPKYATNGSITAAVNLRRRPNVPALGRFIPTRVATMAGRYAFVVLVALVATWLVFVIRLEHPQEMFNVARLKTWLRSSYRLLDGTEMNSEAGGRERQLDVNNETRTNVFHGGDGISEAGDGAGRKDQSANSSSSSEKIILFWNSLFAKADFGLGIGSRPFRKSRCAHTSCKTTTDKAYFDVADMIIFHGFQLRAADLPTRTRHDQIWVFFNLENPLRTAFHLPGMNDKFNLTVTYLDSPDTDFRFGVKPTPCSDAYALPDEQAIRNKSRMAAWIVSDCIVHSTRLEYVKELAKYIQVDVYGACGNLTCPREPKEESARCFRQIDERYFFYLALENAYCKDYVTEKPVKATRMNIVPVVLGYVNYSAILPPGSFIDVRDFSSPRHLADHLTYLSQNITEYMRHLAWKATFPYLLRIRGAKAALTCFLCDVLHDAGYPFKSNFDLQQYWNPDALCLVGDAERKAVHLTD